MIPLEGKKDCAHARGILGCLGGRQDLHVLPTIPKGVKFHDGTDFNPEAVKINFERVIDPHLDLVAYSTFKNIESIEMRDDYSVIITLKGPGARFMTSLVQYTAIYESTPLTKAPHEMQARPVGIGSFRLVRFELDHLVFERNDECWGGKFHLERLEWRQIPGSSSQLN